MTPLVLKDSLDADQSFTFIGNGDNNSLIYERKGTTLMGRARIVLTLAGNGKVNRIKGKLQVPNVCVDDTSCPTPTVTYTQVASFDVSAVLFSDEKSRQDLYAMFSSLIATDNVEAMVVDGISPTA